MLDSDPALRKRAAQIIQVYHHCKHHRSFHLDACLTKTKFCVQYPHDPKRFAAYLQKAMQNDLNQASSRPAFSPPRKMVHSPDLPPWIRQQSQQSKEIQDELSAAQKEEIEQLLLALGELKSCYDKNLARKQFCRHCSLTVVEYVNGRGDFHDNCRKLVTKYFPIDINNTKIEGIG